MTTPGELLSRRRHHRQILDDETEDRHPMAVVLPTPGWIWVAVVVMVLCMAAYMIVGIGASRP
jgi:hypothetical protein